MYVYMHQLISAIHHTLNHYYSLYVVPTRTECMYILCVAFNYREHLSSYHKVCISYMLVKGTVSQDFRPLIFWPSLLEKNLDFQKIRTVIRIEFEV